ncbi:MAG: MBL fold metallo-hydrolase [Candidatus Obscuribacterales bacterium]|nr:MBL fold metallo-hydrolase [Candidatus Obscuribacterales bacterium]
MLLKQFSLACLSHFSYLVADNTKRLACVIDPQRDIDIYLAEAKASNLTIKYVVLTHCHADFASGHLELAKAVNATVCMGAKADTKFPFQRLSEGNLLEIGSVTLKVLETPGHTLESICLVAYDKTADADKPVAVFTGDTLFLGDVGRPDLLASVGLSAKDLSGMMFDSLQTKLATLPDETIVYPAHGAGSSCGKNLSSDSSSTMKIQKLTNWALKATDKAKFIEELSGYQTKPPQYFAYTAEYNKQDHLLLTESLTSELKPLTLTDLLHLQKNDAQILDVRDASDFAKCHIQGSINIGLSGKYANWCGCILNPKKPIVIVANKGDERQAAMRLGRIGFDNVQGFLQDVHDALTSKSAPIETSERLNSKELTEAISAGLKTVLDVRTLDEFNGNHIDGAIHIPLTELKERISEIPTSTNLAVVCAGGYRSSIAASLLRKVGFANVTDLIGGMGAYQKDMVSTS